MSHRYIPLTETDKQEMLETIGIQSIDELFADILKKFALIVRLLLKRENRRLLY